MVALDADLLVLQGGQDEILLTAAEVNRNLVYTMFACFSRD